MKKVFQNLKEAHDVITTRTKVILGVFALITACFFAAGVYAVWNGDDGRSTNCQEIIEVRNDVVEALDILTENSQDPQVVKARSVISKPQCHP